MRRVMVVMIALLLGVSAPAGADWLDDMLSASEAPSAGVSTGGNLWAYGGRLKVAPTRRSIHPFNITPPHLYSTPCGFDLFFGGFSMMNPDQLVALAQGVISAAPAYAFNLALGQLCAGCSSTMQHLNSIIMKLNNIGMDSCTVLHMAGEAIGLEGARQAAQEGETSGLLGTINQHLKRLDKKIGDLMKDFKVTSGKNSKMTRQLAELLIPDGSDTTDYFWRRIMIVKGLCNAANHCGSWTASYQGVPRQLFPSPGDFASFLRALAGDFRLQKDPGQVGGNCPSSLTELFGHCFTSWLTGGNCGGCEAKRLLSAEIITPVLNLQQDIIDPNDSSDVDWGLLTCNGGSFDFLDDFAGKGRIFEAPPGSDCVESFATLITSPPPKQRIEQEFQQLAANIEARGGASPMDPTDSSLIYSRILAPYYKAVKMAHIADPSLEDLVRDEVAKSIGLAYAVGLLSASIDSAVNLLDEADTLTASADSKALQQICTGCTAMASTWIPNARISLLRFKAFVQKKAQGQLNKSKEHILAALQGYDVEGAENSPTGGGSNEPGGGRQ